MRFLKTNYTYGFHVSKFPTFVQTIMYVLTKTPFSAFQIYSSNRSQLSGEIKYSVGDLVQARKLLDDYNLYMCFHANLLYNLAGKSDPSSESQRIHILKNTIRHFLKELDMGVVLGCGSVVHIGCSRDKEIGIKTIAYAICELLTQETEDSEELSEILGISQEEFISRRKVILENCAEDSKIGRTLEEIKEIIDLVPEHLHPQIKICIDTAHGYGGGICDWGKPEEVEKFYQNFEHIIGLDFLEVFHLNDSRRSEKKANNAFFNSKKDRHENLGLGYIFEGDGNLGLIKFFELARKHNKKIIGEPPGKTDEGDEAPGGRWDWKFVEKLLENSKYPLIIND